jgi:hypothetical protein
MDKINFKTIINTYHNGEIISEGITFAEFFEFTLVESIGNFADALDIINYCIPLLTGETEQLSLMFMSGNNWTLEKVDS